MELEESHKSILEISLRLQRSLGLQWGRWPLVHARVTGPLSPGVVFA